MAKYQAKFAEHDDLKVTYLLHIANELAEANRLKRMELSIEINQHKGDNSKALKILWDDS